MVLGGGADHGRAADVDVLDAVVEGGAAATVCFERIEIDDQEIDGGDLVLLRLRHVLGVAAHSEQAAVNLGMQGLDAAVDDFGKPVTSATSVTANPRP